MNIRRTHSKDITGIEACARKAYAMYVDHIGHEPAPMIADFKTAIAEESVYVVVKEDAVEGFVVFFPRGDHLHLENVAVFPRNKGKGLGGMLISFVEKEALLRGFKAVELYTNEKMTENLKMYPKLGYKELGRRKEGGFDRVFFRKAIANFTDLDATQILDHR